MSGPAPCDKKCSSEHHVDPLFHMYRRGLGMSHGPAPCDKKCRLENQTLFCFLGKVWEQD